MTSNSLVDSFPTQFHLLGYGMAQYKLPSSSRQPSLARETTAAHKNQMYAVSEGPQVTSLYQDSQATLNDKVAVSSF